MSDLRLTFDGSNLVLSDESGTRLNIPAVSGKIGYQDQRYTDFRNHGPIPEGAYSFSVEDIQTPSFRDSFLSPLGLGAWPAHGGHEVGWGLIRAPLSADVSTNTFGRGGFFIHGGTTPGSAGCIDVLGWDLPLFSYIRALDDEDGVIHLTVDYPALPGDPRCFPAHTPIAISLSETRPISDIRVGDTVLAFDPSADLGRGALIPRKVVRLYRNTTEEWVKLTWADGGEAKELIATPGHHFLDRFGNFPTIEEMLESGRATVVLASGELTEVAAERVVWSAETAHMFEQAEAVGMVAGNAALKPAAIDAWQTYNFEVEDLHTYVAGGVRVHNKSGFLGRVGNTIDTALDNLLGGNDGDGSLRDKLTDLATSPLHAAGEIVGGFLDGVKAVAKGLGEGFAALARGDIGGAIGAVARGIGEGARSVVEGIGRAVEAVGRAIGNAVEAVVDTVRGWFDPVVLDLDGDGIELTGMGQTGKKPEFQGKPVQGGGYFGGSENR